MCDKTTSIFVINKDTGMLTSSYYFIDITIVEAEATLQTAHGNITGLRAHSYQTFIAQVEFPIANKSQTW